MPTLPPVPAWDAFHPLIVHFPVALLLAAPLLVLAALLAPVRHRRGIALAALLLMVLGTAGAFAAVKSGEAAEGRAEAVPGAEEVLEEHEESGERARNIFAVLTLVYGALLGGPVLRRKQDGGPHAGLSLLFLAAYLAGTLYLIETATLGGKLVHELGVKGAGALPAEEVGEEL